MLFSVNVACIKEISIQTFITKYNNKKCHKTLPLSNFYTKDNVDVSGGFHVIVKQLGTGLKFDFPQLKHPMERAF